MAELHDASAADGELGSDNVKRRLAWLEAGNGHRTYQLDGDWHVLREHGMLVARNKDLGLAMDTCDRAGKRRGLGLVL